MFYLPSDTPQLSPVHRQTLAKQKIDQDSPGTILQDFHTLIDFVGEKGVEVSGQYHLLNLKLLAPLNARMTHPLELRLKRPQLKSYPHLNGLYLLLRTTGLGQIYTMTKKPRLFIDQELLSSWLNLNPTERYFTLLETWALRGQEAIIGQGRGGLRDFPLANWGYFFQRVPAEGLPVAGNSEAEHTLRYWPGLHNLAMLELFGLATIKPAPPVEGQGWQIERVFRTPLGDALLALLGNYLRDHFDEILSEMDDLSEIPFGVLQPAVQPYFPEWQNNLTFPDVGFREGIYIFKVGWSDVWRKIAIPANLSLDDLSSAILNAFRFDYDHLYQFTYPNRFGAYKRAVHPYMDDYTPATEVRIGELPLKPGGRMIYLYDFGDNWEFGVTLERIDPPDPKISKPTVVEKQGRAPKQYGW